MYLSRLILNPRARRVQRELANLYELHRTLMRSFPASLPDDERVLFRVDTDPRRAVPTILLQSHTRPDWAWLDDPGARGYLLAAPETKPFDLSFTPSQVLAFRLRANPTVKRRFNEKDHKRVGLYREEDQRAWLERKGEAGGFRVLSVAIAGEGSMNGRLHREDETHQLNLLAVRFEGVLQVADPARLWDTVQNGIGSGKGLGFGLLSLARPA